METIHESSKLKFVNSEEIRNEKEWWKLKNSEFLMYHPLSAKFLVNGMAWLGTLTFIIISIILYYKLHPVSGIILGLLTIVYFINMLKFSNKINKSKINLSDLSVGIRP